MFASLTVVCAWVTFPTAVPFTLQTLAVFLTALFLDFKYSLLSIFIYIGIGAVGFPAFSGFQGGAGVLLGPTGGYITGFVFIILAVGIAKKLFPDSFFAEIFSLITGLALCYLFGTIWFMLVSKTDFISAIIICVLPYVVFDGMKILLALILCKKLRKIINKFIG